MNDRQRAVLGVADWLLAALDARLARVVASTTPRDPNRCPRAACGAELGPWTRGAAAGVRWRRCGTCDYREIVRFDFEHYRRVLAARKERTSV